MKKFILLVILILLFAQIYFAVSSGGGGGANYTRTFDESNLQCSKQNTLKERVSCRYNLPENYEGLNFLPEECRSVTNKERDECLELYGNVRPCWAIYSKVFQSQTEKDKNRDICIKRKVGLQNIREEKSNCKTTGCLQDLRKKVYSVVKLRLYSLEEKAEALEEKGISKEKIIEIVSFLEQEKINFNNAKSIDERKEIVQKVKQKWHEFKKEVVAVLKAMERDQ